MIKAKVAFWRAGFFQPIRAFWKLFRLLWLAEKGRLSKKATFVLIM